MFVLYISSNISGFPVTALLRLPALMRFDEGAKKNGAQKLHRTPQFERSALFKSSAKPLDYCIHI